MQEEQKKTPKIRRYTVKIFLCICIASFLAVFKMYADGTIHNNSTASYFICFLIPTTIVFMQMRFFQLAKIDHSNLFEELEEARPVPQMFMFLCFCFSLNYGYIIVSSSFDIVHDITITTSHPEIVSIELGNLYPSMPIQMEEKGEDKAAIHIPAAYQKHPSRVKEFFYDLKKQKIRKDFCVRVIISEDNHPMLLNALGVEAGSKIPLELSPEHAKTLDETQKLQDITTGSGYHPCYLAIPITNPKIRLMLDPDQEDEMHIINQIRIQKYGSFDMNRISVEDYCLNYYILINEAIIERNSIMFIFSNHLMVGSQLAGIACYSSYRYQTGDFHTISLDQLYNSNTDIVSPLILPNTARFFDDISSSFRILPQSWRGFQKRLRQRRTGQIWSYSQPGRHY